MSCGCENGIAMRMPKGDHIYCESCPDGRQLAALSKGPPLDPNRAFTMEQISDIMSAQPMTMDYAGLLSPDPAAKQTGFIYHWPWPDQPHKIRITALSVPLIFEKVWMRTDLAHMESLIKGDSVEVEVPPQGKLKFDCDRSAVRIEALDGMGANSSFAMTREQITNAAETWARFNGFEGGTCGDCKATINHPCGMGHTYICECGGRIATLMSGAGMGPHEKPNLGPDRFTIIAGLHSDKVILEPTRHYRITSFQERTLEIKPIFPYGMSIVVQPGDHADVCIGMGCVFEKPLGTLVELME